MRRSTEIIACLILYVCCYSAPTVFALPTGTVTVDLGYARYQGVPFLDPITNITNTQFLGIRYAAAPTGRGCFFSFFCFLLFNIYFFTGNSIGEIQKASTSFLHSRCSVSKRTAIPMYAIRGWHGS